MLDYRCLFVGWWPVAQAYRSSLSRKEVSIYIGCDLSKYERRT